MLIQRFDILRLVIGTQCLLIIIAYYQYTRHKPGLQHCRQKISTTCDVIEQNESELANIDFKMQQIIALNFLCI